MPSGVTDSPCPKPVWTSRTGFHLLKSPLNKGNPHAQRISTRTCLPTCSSTPPQLLHSLPGPGPSPAKALTSHVCHLLPMDGHVASRFLQWHPRSTAPSPGHVCPLSIQNSSSLTAFHPTSLPTCLTAAQSPLIVSESPSSSLKHLPVSSWVTTACRCCTQLPCSGLGTSSVPATSASIPPALQCPGHCVGLDPGNTGKSAFSISLLATHGLAQDPTER